MRYTAEDHPHHSNSLKHYRHMADYRQRAYGPTATGEIKLTPWDKVKKVVKRGRNKR